MFFFTLSTGGGAWGGYPSGSGRTRLPHGPGSRQGLRVCTATVYRMCERGELGHMRVANAIRVSTASLDAFIRSSRLALKAGRRRPIA
jgi:hypothetical protein